MTTDIAPRPHVASSARGGAEPRAMAGGARATSLSGTLFTALHRPVDAASLAVLRMLFGALLAASVVRYFATDWIEHFYVTRTFHFTYYGFAWIRPLPSPYIELTFVVLGVAAVFVALGLFYRAAIAVALVAFTYLHLLDVTNYLNHYYLVSLLLAVMCVLPLHRTWSLDARRRPALARATIPAWMLYVVRFQVGVVYVFAALAKAGPDWLLYGQPLEIWLRMRTDTPIVGPLFDEPGVALAMSWGGFLYDLTIVGWLSWKRTRPFAFVVVCAFHFMTMVLFRIGIFPFVMTLAALVFFEPGWPRRWLDAARRAVGGASAADAAHEPNHAIGPERWRLGQLGALAIVVWALTQTLIPLRTHLYGGNVLWHEQGMRWSWRVMVREKNGDVAYRVRMDGEPRERRFIPSDFGLTREQESEFAGQPDLILQLAHHIRDELEARGHREVEVRADAFVSLNGRPSTRLVDPTVDLARVEDGFGPAAWILPAPDTPPPSVSARLLER